MLQLPKILKDYEKEIGNLNPDLQTIKFERLEEPYKLLMLDHWGKLEKILPKNKSFSRKEVAEYFEPGNLGEFCYVSGFIATMLWGFGEKNEAGPVKTWLGINTPNIEGFLKHMDNAKNHLTKGADHFGAALKDVMNIKEIGQSFGSKLLYFLGMHLSSKNSNKNLVQPLILDSLVCSSLVAILGTVDAHTHFYISKSSVMNNKVCEGYVNYCTCMNEWGKELGCRADQIEMFLFTQNKNMKKISGTRQITN